MIKCHICETFRLKRFWDMNIIIKREATETAQVTSYQLCQADVGNCFLILLMINNSSYTEMALQGIVGAVEATWTNKQQFCKKQVILYLSSRRLCGPILGSHLSSLLYNTKKHKKEIGDFIVSVENMLLAFLSDKRFGQKLFRNLQLTEKALKDAVTAVHGSQ
ncbi:hypothetical protein T459_17601 [Capsicum annuum]|uniref:Clp R domain-containing protein n=1 Tax=Capsicum annuum TaxID=4072 RepID=A0A2G2ZC53_CAPAN|nr:hypothetical protein T459_17601 [Capsicum annuum]